MNEFVDQKLVRAIGEYLKIPSIRKTIIGGWQSMLSTKLKELAKQSSNDKKYRDFFGGLDTDKMLKDKDVLLKQWKTTLTNSSSMAAYKTYLHHYTAKLKGMVRLVNKKHGIVADHTIENYLYATHLKTYLFKQQVGYEVREKKKNGDGYETLPSSKLKDQRPKKTTRIKGYIYELLDEYEIGEKSIMELLK